MRGRAPGRQLGISQPNVSQHLAVLRAAGLVDAERDGREVHYRLTDPDVMVACELMRGVLERRLRRLAEMSSHDGPVAAPTSPSADRMVHEVIRWTNR